MKPHKISCHRISCQKYENELLQFILQEITTIRNLAIICHAFIPPPPPFHMSFSYAKGEPHVISIGVFPRRRWKTLNRLKVACSLCYMITLSIRVIVMNCDNVHTCTCSLINSLHPITFLHFLLKFLKRTLRENLWQYGDNDIMSTDRELIDVIQYRFESCFDNGHFSKNRSMSHTSIFSIRNQPTLST